MNAAKLLVDDTADLRLSWQSVACPADRTAGILALLQALDPDIGTAKLTVATAVVDRLLAKQRPHDRQRQQERCARWVATALQNGAGAAHRWTNKENALTATLTAEGCYPPQTIAQQHRYRWTEV